MVCSVYDINLWVTLFICIVLFTRSSVWAGSPPAAAGDQQSPQQQSAQKRSQTRRTGWVQENRVGTGEQGGYGQTGWVRANKGGSWQAGFVKVDRVVLADRVGPANLFSPFVYYFGNW